MSGQKDIFDRFVITEKARQKYQDSRLNQVFFSTAPFLIEFVGTCTLVFTIGTSTSETTGNPSHAPLAIGFSLMAMIFMGGHISGGHFNPAVTLGILATGRGKMHWAKACGYVLVQVAGSVVGAFFVYLVTNPNRVFGPKIADDHSLPAAIILEAFVTCGLVSVVLNVATTKATSDNSFYGLSIGCVVIAGAYSVGNITSGAFNPAVATGPHLVAWIMGKPFATELWVYWLGPLLGAAVAAGFFRITNPKEYDVHQQSAGIMPDVLDADKQRPIEYHSINEAITDDKL